MAFNICEVDEVETVPEISAPPAVGGAGSSATPHTPGEFLRCLFGDEDLHGYIAICTERDWRGKTFAVSDWEQAGKEAERLSQTHDVYFGLGLHPQTGRAGAEKVSAIPGLWIEIDVKGPGHTKENLPPTMQDARRILEALPLKPTILISSGGGIHAYYLFREPWIFEGKDEWREAAKLSSRFQSTLQAQASTFGWEIDSTPDLARVLRLPRTFNRKLEQPRPVELIEWHPECRYNPSGFEPFLLEGNSPETVGGHRAERGSGGDANAQFNRPPDRIEPILEGCACVRHYRDDAAILPNPEWKIMLEIVGRCEGGRELAHEWSKPYPGYTRKETEAELDRIWSFGPRTCVNIRQNGGEPYCSACPNWRRITSPINLNNRSTLQAGGKEQLTDWGNARIFAERHGAEVRHVTGWGWLAWTGKRWEPKAEKAVSRMCQDVAKGVYQDALNNADPAFQRSQSAHGLKSLGEQRLKAMMKVGESQPEIEAQPEDFDSNNWLLNCENGTIDLRTGDCYPQRQADMITKLAPVVYDREAKSVLFHAFLNKIYAGKQDLISYVQRAIGYSLTGQQSERVLFVLQGGGRNGKTTLLEIIRFVLGDYAGQIPIRALMSQKNGGGLNATPEFADLRGLRFVTSSETEDGQALAESTIKLLTGGNTVKARGLYQGYTEFAPTHHIFLDCNHKPDVRGTDEAIWDRIRLIPFDVRIPDEDVDANLLEKLKEEAPGILNWAVQGCLEWQRIGGLGTPPDVIKAGKEYRDENDIFGQFLDERTEKAPRSEMLRPDDLYQIFCGYCRLGGYREPNKTQFRRMVAACPRIERGLHPRSRLAVYFGIRIRHQDIVLEEYTANQNLHLVRDLQVGQ